MPLALFAKQKAAPADDFDIELDDRKIRVNVTRNRNARRFILRVSAATRSVNLTLPLRGSMREARNFVGRHRDWLKTQFSQLPEPRPFTPGAIVPLRDLPHRILNVATGRGVVQISENDNGLPSLCVSGDPAHLPRRLTDWLKKQARADLARQVEIHADTLGVKPGKISLRDTRSRWGSCAANGALSFSWRLVLAPPHVLDYVAAHEVAHMQEMNHSPAFWALVKDTSADTVAAKKWLKAHGRDLHGIGVAP